MPQPTVFAWTARSASRAAPYIWATLMAIGVGLLAPAIGWAVIVVGNIVLAYALIRVEEADLQSRYGDTFRVYRSMVPAFSRV